ncbi:MAG: [protein-PII] uridylyltransferase [Nocardioidaceae bacterium]
MTEAERWVRVQAADALCAAAFDAAVEGVRGGYGGQGLALVAVGGYGRRELAPYSDLDVVLVHADDRDASVLAPDVWYPLWDQTAKLDHSVRAESDVAKAAAADLRVALGLLDTRHLAGDPALTMRVRAAILAQWRRDARSQLPALHELVRSRAERAGELGHASVPDLKESVGGLRDATILKALVMSWLVDVPHAELESNRRALLDMRDVLQGIAGRASDRIAPELWAPLAEGLGLTGAEAAQRQVRSVARRLTHLSRLTWHQVEAVLARPSGVRPRRPHLEPVAPGVALSADEVVLDRGADPAKDPLLLLRTATEAAERSLMLAPATMARLVRTSPAIPEPWPDEARQLLTRLLAAGPGLLEVWETLEETGALSMILPEFEAVLLLPHASAMHRFTVDRHLVETCIEASRLIRRVSRPDLLMVAAILHDIGKASWGDHSVTGAPVAREAALRMGFAESDADKIAALVRWHLLLAETATTRDLEDTSTARYVIERVPDVETFDLLAVLTEADAKATSPQAWTSWRASLVAELCRRVRAFRRDPEAVPADAHVRVDIPAAARRGELVVEIAADETSARVTVVGPDQIGLMAAAAGALSLAGANVRSARAWAQDQYAISVWETDAPYLDPAVLRTRLDAVLTGKVDPAARLKRRRGTLEPALEIRYDASREATVLEVRSEDRPGVVYLVARELAGLAMTVRSAHVATLGPQALDVFYVQEQGAGALTDERAATAVHAIRAALS